MTSTAGRRVAPRRGQRSAAPVGHADPHDGRDRRPGTDRAPDASAEVEVSDTPVGLKILLTPDGLPAAPEGTYYECWLSDGDVRVSAGTFHLRGGSGEIELWAGVVGPDFTHLAVTLEPIDDDLDSSGDAYLRGTFRLDD